MAKKHCWKYETLSSHAIDSEVSGLSESTFRAVSVLILPPSALVTFASWAGSQIIITKIHHLKNLFTDVFSDKIPQRQKERLNFCIQYHQHIFK